MDYRVVKPFTDTRVVRTPDYPYDELAHGQYMIGNHADMYAQLHYMFMNLIFIY